MPTSDEPRAIVFDFDGVILESADIKTRAFGRLFAESDPHHVDAIVRFHLAEVGMSRFEKFRIIYRDILRRPLGEPELDELGGRFSALVLDEILRCEFVPGARAFLERRRGRQALCVASATPEEELRDIVHRRGLAELFDRVYGSPRPKADILRRIVGELGLDPEEALFVGDARSDLEAALAVGTRFVGRVPSGCANAFEGHDVALVEDLAALEHKWDAIVAVRPLRAR